MDWNYQIKDYWERWTGEAPTSHAEELSVKQFADNLGLAATDLVKALQEEGIVVPDTAASIGQVAEANDRRPQLQPRAREGFTTALWRRSK